MIDKWLEVLVRWLVKRKSLPGRKAGRYTQFVQHGENCGFPTYSVQAFPLRGSNGWRAGRIEWSNLLHAYLFYPYSEGTREHFTMAHLAEIHAMLKELAQSTGRAI